MLVLLGYLLSGGSVAAIQVPLALQLRESDQPLHLIQSTASVEYDDETVHFIQSTAHMVSGTEWGSIETTDAEDKQGKTAKKEHKGKQDKHPKTSQLQTDEKIWPFTSSSDEAAADELVTASKTARHLHGHRHSQQKVPGMQRPTSKRAARLVTANEGSGIADDRPNILFLMTDSMDGRLLDDELPESRVFEMPFLQKMLATNGTQFARAYSNNPVCVPSRSSMMVGISSEKIRVWGNNRGIAASHHGVLDDMCVKTYGEANCRSWAEEQGYPITLLAKMKEEGYYVRAEGTVDAGAGHGNKEKHRASVAGEQHSISFTNPTGPDFFRISGVLVQESNGSGFEETGVTQSAESYSLYDEIPRDACLKWIREELPNPEDAEKPFFLYCSFRLPHYPYKATQKYYDMIKEENIFMPTWSPGFPQHSNDWHPYDIYKSYQDGVIGEMDKEGITRMRRIFYAMCVNADENLGMIWRALFDEKGYSLENTYVIHVSDHGELAFDHRQMMKSSLFEGSVRVPFYIAGPNIPKGKRLNHLTSLLDVFPTLLDMAAVGDATSYERLEGRSLLKAATGQSSAPAKWQLPEEDTRDFVWSQYNWVQVNGGSYMARSGNWKLMVYGHTYNFAKDYQPQLFNIEHDPEELHNVADTNPEIVDWLVRKLNEEGVRYVQADFEAGRCAFQHMRFSVDNTTWLNEQRSYDMAKTQFSQFNTWPGWHIELDDSLQQFDRWLQEAKAKYPQILQPAGSSLYVQSSSPTVGGYLPYSVLKETYLSSP